MRDGPRRSIALAIFSFASVAFAQPTTPGYPERVLQWTVKNGETCDDIAEALYGSASYRALLERYNAIHCVAGSALPDGTTLVVPEKPTTLPTARLRWMKPDVRARAAGGAWSAAEPGMPLYERTSVNTLEKARADILFVDRTRVVLGEHTLVVIYDTAKHTDVAQTIPSVELETGEVQAGLAALRGKPFEVATEGGLVSGSSRDTVVRAKTNRATVSVFDGSTKVTSAGQSVDVPKHYGTSFHRSGAPARPHPLPVAPRFTQASSEGVLLAEAGNSVIVAGWDAVPNSSSYRIEVARDADFTELLLREEVPARVRAFRAEKLPPGAYFMRVRAIDRDDFLGIASQPRALVLAETRIDSGRIQADRIELSRYAKLRFSAFEGLELAIDRGPFAKVPDVLDASSVAPSELGLRVQGMGVRRFAIRYRPASAEIETERRSGALYVHVTFSGLEGIDIAQRVRPVLWVTTRDGQRQHFELDQNFSAALPDLAPRSLYVLDAHGAALGALELEPANQSIGEALGVESPIVSPSPLDSADWWAPARPNAVALATTGYVRDRRIGLMLGARASGSLGAFGLDTRVTTPEITGPPADGSAWFRLRWRALGSESAGLELGPAAELAIPLSTTSPPARAGLGLAIGGAGFLANLGGRVRLSDSAERRDAPSVQGFVLAGKTFDALDWLRFYALIDAHALDHPERDALAIRGGFALGGEVGERVFAGAALRVSPWDDAGGTLIGQLSLGLRDGR